MRGAAARPWAHPACREPGRRPSAVAVRHEMGRRPGGCYDATMAKPEVAKEAGAERRAHARFDIHLPVKVTFVASPLVTRGSSKMRAATSSPQAQAPSALESVSVYALALDVSERGMKIEIAGLSTRIFLD